MKKYLISGIAPLSNTGVGCLIEALEPQARKNNYKVLYPKYIKNCNKKTLLNAPIRLYKILQRMIIKIVYSYQINRIKNSEVILIHPQTIGYKKFIELIRNNDIVKNYIMDNSFFCIKSYNTLNGSECLKCLESIDSCDKNCAPFPKAYNKDFNLNYLNEYKKHSKKMFFYAQNKQQEQLLRIYFGKNTNVKLVGLDVFENFDNNIIKDDKNKYDIVFHGANHEAKGVNYFIKLAQELPEFSFFIPNDINELKSSVIPKNIVCNKVSWSTGLKDIVINAKLVLNPSIWSAPVEGALLKSLHYNGNVGVVLTMYGFVSDVPDDILLHLSHDVSVAKNQINEFFTNSINYKKKSRLWLDTYINKSCHTNLIFESFKTHIVN